MPTWMPEIIREHWRILLIAYVASNAIQTMPTPGEKGPTSGPLYKWLFGFLHTSAAAIPRIIYTLFPQFVKYLPFNGQTQAPPVDPNNPQS
jgi:hypothetical protein